MFSYSSRCQGSVRANAQARSSPLSTPLAQSSGRPVHTLLCWRCRSLVLFSLVSTSRLPARLAFLLSLLGAVMAIILALAAIAASTLVSGASHSGTITHAALAASATKSAAGSTPLPLTQYSYAYDQVVSQSCPCSEPRARHDTSASPTNPHPTSRSIPAISSQPVPVPSWTPGMFDESRVKGMVARARGGLRDRKSVV